MNSSHNENRRETPRHPVRAYASLIHETDHWNVHLLDMSASGARFALLEEYDLNPGDRISLTIELDDVRSPDMEGLIDESAHKLMRLRGTVVHCNQHMLGVEYQPVSEVDRILMTMLLSRE